MTSPMHGVGMQELRNVMMHVDYVNVKAVLLCCCCRQISRLRGSRQLLLPDEWCAYTEVSRAGLSTIAAVTGSAG